VAEVSSAGLQEIEPDLDTRSGEGGRGSLLHQEEMTEAARLLLSSPALGPAAAASGDGRPRKTRWSTLNPFLTAGVSLSTSPWSSAQEWKLYSRLLEQSLARATVTSQGRPKGGEVDSQRERARQTEPVWARGPAGPAGSTGSPGGRGGSRRAAGSAGVAVTPRDGAQLLQVAMGRSPALLSQHPEGAGGVHGGANPQPHGHRRRLWSLGAREEEGPSRGLGASCDPPSRWAARARGHGAL